MFAEHRGTVAWALGFLAYFPVPFLNILVVGIVQLIVGVRLRRRGGLAALNGTRAANWALMQLGYLVLLVLVILVAALTGEPTGDGVAFSGPAQVAVAVVLGLYVVVGICQLVFAIVGTVQAASGRAVRLPVVPFLRAP